MEDVVAREDADTRTTIAMEPQECRQRRSVVFVKATITVTSAIQSENTRNELRQLRQINCALNALNRVISMDPATTRKTVIRANLYDIILRCAPLLVTICALCRRRNGLLSCYKSPPSKSGTYEITRRNPRGSASSSTAVHNERTRRKGWYRSWAHCRLEQMPSMSGLSRNRQVYP